MVNEGDPATTLGLAISIPEIILIVWVATFAAELFRKVSTTTTKTFKLHVKSNLIVFLLVSQ